MKRYLIILAALGLALGLSPAPAGAVPYASHTYRACHDHHGLTHTNSEHPEVCMRVTVTRQADGWGWVVNRIYAYAYNDNPSGDEDCFEGDGLGLFEQPLAVDVNPMEVTGWRTDAPSVQQWVRTAPNLKRDNDCKVVWEPVVSANNEEISVSFQYVPKLNAAPDDGRTLVLHLAVGSWYCTNDVEECSMVS